MRIVIPAAFRTGCALMASFLAAVSLSATAAVPPVPSASAVATVPAVPSASAVPEIAAASTDPRGDAPSGHAGSPGQTSAGPTTANTDRVAPGGRFVWPLPPRPVILRRFEQPRDQWAAGHRGVDLAASVGQPVLSAGEGAVAFSGVIAGRGVITVAHAGGLRTTYEPVDERLAAGTVVRRGMPIGVLSSTPGHCVPLACLHWGAISGQTYRDPLSLLGFGHPILLPLS